MILYLKLFLEVALSIMEPYAAGYGLKEEEKDRHTGTVLFTKKNVLLDSVVTIATVILLLSIIELYKNHKK